MAEHGPTGVAGVRLVPSPSEVPGSVGDAGLLVARNDSYEDLTLALEETKIRAGGRGRVERQKSAGSISEIVSQAGGNDTSEEVSSTTTPVGVSAVPSVDADVDEDDVVVVGARELLRDEGRERSPTHTQHEEEVGSEAWKKHDKHVFVLSEAGKPIYSRYGNEEKLVTLMGVMQALVSIVQDSQDHIRCLVSGGHKFVFLVRRPVILVAVSHTSESLPQLLIQLNYVYNQILSILTSTQLRRIFERRRNYDLRNLLSGAEKFLDNLLRSMSDDPSTLLGAVRCLPLASSVREGVGQAIVGSTRVKDLVFALLVTRSQLITLVRLKKYSLHPSDLHLIFNLISASTSFQTAESWAPVCLPKFDSSGYLYAHISYLDEECSVCLLLLTVNREEFFTLSQCKQRIVERMRKSNSLHHITQAPGSFHTHEVGIADLRHFIYKSKTTAQYTSPEMESPYNTDKDKKRLFHLYQLLHHRVHSQSRPLRILYHMGCKETVLAWVTPGFELYATFGPLVSKPAAISAINKLLRWIKKEEDRLFILNSPTF